MDKHAKRRKHDTSRHVSRKEDLRVLRRDVPPKFGFFQFIESSADLGLTDK